MYGDLNCRQGGLTKSCKKGNGELTAKAILKGRLENKKAAIHHEIHFTFSREGDEAEVNGGSIHRLAAKQLIQEKQDAYNNRSRTWSDEKKDAFKHTVIFISKATNIVSKFTSFVAVDKDNHQPVSGPLKKRPGFGRKEVIYIVIRRAVQMTSVKTRTARVCVTPLWQSITSTRMTFTKKKREIVWPNEG